jgi:hypothetical protein
MKPLSLWRRKPKVVKDLQIDEVSAVSAGANPLSKVVLLKRDADRELKTKTDHAVACLAKSVQSIVNDSGANKNEMLGRSFAQFLQHIGKLTKTKIPLEAVVGLNEIFKNDNERSEPDLSDTDAGMPDRRGRRRREDAHARLDAAMASDVDRDHADDDEDEGESESGSGGESTDQLERAERAMKGTTMKLMDIAKKYGWQNICKQFVENGTGSFSETEVTQMLTSVAQKSYPDLTPDVAFSKLYSSQTADGELARRTTLAARDAGFISKLAGSTPHFHASADDGPAGRPGLASLRPRVTGGRQALAVDNPKSALDQLNELAAEQRRQNKTLSESGAFAAVYTDPKNAELVRLEREQNCPVSTGL